MEEVVYLPSYTVNERSLVMWTINDESGCSAEVLDTDGVLYVVDQKPTDILHESCLEWGATYRGRREWVRAVTSKGGKFAIPVDPTNNTCAVPLQSPNHRACIWLFVENIKVYKSVGVDRKRTRIYFHSSDIIEVPVSYYIVDSQYKHGVCAMHRFNWRNKRGVNRSRE